MFQNLFQPQLQCEVAKHPTELLQRKDAQGGLARLGHKAEIERPPWLPVQALITKHENDFLH